MELPGVVARCGPPLGTVLLLVSLAACGTDGETTPTAESPGTQPSATATVTGVPSPSLAPAPSVSASPQLPKPSGRPVFGKAPPPWLGKRVLPLAANGLGEVRRT